MGKNLENNKKAFAELKKNPDERSVFSRDGFIEYQQGLNTIVYGKVTASYGGCGAIAVWNLLKALSIAPDEAVVFDEMENGCILGGLLGTSVLFVKKYLSGRGHRVNMYCSLKEFKKAFSRMGIVYYMRKNMTAHYVAFTPAGVNEKGEYIYRFHNTSAGAYWKTNDEDGIKYIESIYMTMEDFLKESGAKVKVFYDVR